MSVQFAYRGPEIEYTLCVYWCPQMKESLFPRIDGEQRLEDQSIKEGANDLFSAPVFSFHFF